MEVKRTTPVQFGHFRPVEARATKSFALLLNDNAATPMNAEKGLQKYIQKRSREDGFDVAYIKNKRGNYVFAVIDNQSDKVVTQYKPDAYCPSGFERATRFLTASLKDIHQNKLDGKISQFGVIKQSIKAVWKFTQRVIKSEFDRTEALPSGMRAAGYRAAHMETFAK